MFKKILATLAAVVLGAGLSIVAVAAPASAHTPNHDISCGSAWFSGTSYEGNSSANSLIIKVDGEVKLNKTFGGSISQANATVTYDGTTSHTVEIILDAIGGSGPNTQYDKTYTEVTTPCTYPSKDLETTCQAVTIDWGKKLDDSVHIHVKVDVNGTTKQIHAEIDGNIVGGYNGLGVTYTNFDGIVTKVPLTEQQVKSGNFVFTIPNYLPNGTTSYIVKWVQFNDLHFNQDENPAKWIYCGYTDVTVQAEPSVTPPTCDVDGKLVVPTQTGIVWTGGTNGAGPGSYTMVASAAPGYKLTAPYSKPFTVLGATNDCDEPVTVQAVPSATPPTCSAGGKLVVPSQTGIVWTGGTNGAGPGTYNLVAGAADGYVLTAPYSTTIQVLPADESLCKVEPTASVQPGACYPDGDISKKPVQFVFDNSQSELPVTFTIPSIQGFAPVVVTAGGTSGPIAGPVVSHLTGGSWDVYANGEFLVKLTVTPFDQCQEQLIPGDPTSNPEQCVAGDVKNGSVTIVPSPGKIAYTITGGPGNVNIAVPDNAPVTSLPAGTYTVTAHGINGFSVGPQNTWTAPVTVLEPVGCEKIAIPVSTKNGMECAEQGGTEGTYTLPATEWVEWYVNNVKTTTPSTVFFPGDVTVEARITQAGKDAGVFFTDGTQSNTVTHKFVLPEEECDSTLALLEPLAYSTPGTCTTLPSYTLSNTPSEHGGVQWVVAASPAENKDPGTYTAAWGTTVTATATLVDPVNDGFAPEQKTVWTFPFPAKPATCGDLVTLAFTGATGGFVLWIAGAMLLLGGAGIYLTRRLIVAKR